MNPREDLCGLQWCDEADQHDGPHRKRLFDSFAFDIETGKSAIVQLWLQGESARVRGVVLVANSCELGLTWSQVGAVAGTLSNTIRKFA